MKKRLLQKFWKNKSGATAIEYALIMVIVSASIVVSTKEIPTALNTMFESVFAFL